MDTNYNALIQKQRNFFDDDNTRSYSFRKQQLTKLKNVIKQHEQEILNALHQDLGKSDFEGYVSEVGFLYEEINVALKHLNRWMKPKKVSSGLLNFPSKSYISKEPKGVTLIIGPWNYPFQLLLAPVVASMAAGNTCIIKPPEQTPAIAELIEKFITSNFDAAYLAVVQGEGQEVVPKLMNNHRFDHVFFTGSVPVGKKIAEMAAPKLVPCTLELGGKSPVIVDASANLKVAAKRIAFGKWLNAGQTCVAPDYLLVHKSVQAEFEKLLIQTIKDFYGEKPLQSEDYGNIVNKDRFDKLIGYLQNQAIAFGGEADENNLSIAPTLINAVNLDSDLMQEEIFGPILPIISYSNTQEAINLIEQHPFPLALYVFAEKEEVQKAFTEKISFGGGMINNTVLHLTNTNLPFGGVGSSGFGNYHGKYGFDTFSHTKAIMKTATWFDLKQKYPPYNTFVLKIIKRIMH